jgi:hypothetical protein
MYIASFVTVLSWRDKHMVIHGGAACQSIAADKLAQRMADAMRRPLTNLPLQKSLLPISGRLAS